MQKYKYAFPEYRKKNIKRFSKIIATASYYPETVKTNQQIIAENQLKVTDVVISKSLGVEKRRVVSEGVTDSDLLAEAAKRCLEKAHLKADQLSKIIVTKFIGDHILPMTASMVQRKLNCQKAMHAFDLEGGINAFLYALDLATRYINSTLDEEQYILILSGGIHQLAVSKSDPRLAFLFGDGAAAVLLTGSKEKHFLGSYFYSNPELYDHAGSRLLKMEQWFSEEIYEKGDYGLLYNLYQMGNWKDSIDFYLDAAGAVRDNLLRESGISMQDIDYVFVTENNKKIRDMILEKLEIPQTKSVSLIQEYGNTMSAMLPCLLDKAFMDGILKAGMNIMLFSQGEGASGGGLLYRI